MQRKKLPFRFTGNSPVMRTSLLLLLACLLSFSNVMAQPAEVDTSTSEILPYYALNAGLLIPNAEAFPGQDVATMGLPIHIKMTGVIGMRVNPRTNFGIGSGVLFNNRGTTLPIFAEVRGDFLKRRITPFWYCQLGSSIPLFRIEEEPDWWGSPIYEDFKSRGGLYYDAGVGMKVGNEDYATTLSIGFQSMSLSESYRAWGRSYENTYTFQRISIQGGWWF